MIRKNNTWWLILLPLLLIVGQTYSTKLSLASESVTEQTNEKDLDDIEAEACVLASDAAHTVYLPLLLVSGTEETAVPEPMARELAYQVGKTYSYQYEISSHSLFGTVDKENGVLPETPNVVLSYGVANISITAVEDGDIFVGQLVLENPVTCIQNDTGTDDDEFVNDAQALIDLQTPLVFRQHKNGVIVDVQIADTVDPVTANQLKTILNSLQATLTEDDDYPAVENGGQGSYVARYTADLQTEGVQLTRTLDENSFLSFNSQGDAPEIELNNTIHSFLDREEKVFTHISFAEHNNILGDPNDIDPETVEGIAMWGQMSSHGTLALTAVTDTPALRAIDMASYSAADMNASFDELSANTHGIDIDTVDMDAELDALESDPTDLVQIQRLMWLLTADEEAGNNNVVNAIAGRLTSNLTDEALSIAYIDLLGHDGSEMAQTHLSTLIDPASGTSAAVSERLKDQTTVNLALMEKPEPNMVAVMIDVKTDPTGNPHRQNMANAALGALVPALVECDPAMAEMIVTDLKAQLTAAGTDQEQYQALLALGNTEIDNMLPIVQPYLNSSNSKVQWAAYWALRDSEEDEVEELLIGILKDDGLDPGYPLPAAALALKNKPGKPSDNANNTLAGYYGDENPFPTPQGGTFDKKWDYGIGSDHLGGSFPGQMVWKSPPDSDRLEALAAQSIDYYINLPRFKFKQDGTLAQAAAFTNPVDGNDALQEFGYTYAILGKSFNVDYTVSCSNVDGGTIASGYREIVNYNFEYLLWGLITVGSRIEATAAYGIDYSYGWDVCNGADMSAQVNLVPHGEVLATIDGHLTILGVTGGIELQAIIIDVEIPASFEATYSLNNDFEVCAHIPLEWEAMNLKLYFFVDLGKVRIRQKLAWDYVLSADTKDLLPETCFKPE